MFYICQKSWDEMREVVIVGGGIVGLLSAFELTKREIPVIVIDESGGGRRLGREGVFCLRFMHGVTPMR